MSEELQLAGVDTPKTSNSLHTNFPSYAPPFTWFAVILIFSIPVATIPLPLVKTTFVVPASSPNG